MRRSVSRFVLGCSTVVLLGATSGVEGSPGPTAPEPAAEVARQGTIVGVVSDQADQRPLAAVQVTIPGSGFGSLTDASGRFTIGNVPAGEVVVSAQRLGYRPVQRTVQVASGEVVEVDFQLAQDVLGLDQIVVTGTPGGTQVRAIGNVVGRVAAAELTQIAPIGSIQDLLGGREPGLQFHRSSGNIGTGSQIRIRGVSSITMGQQPLIYVDGVRIDNEAAAGPNIRDGRQVSVLEDFSPEEIESIEVIKGAAAATLYGTEASAGVIQIITKRGAQGSPQFDVSVRQGGTWLMNAREKVGWSYNTVPATGEIISFNIWDTEQAAGRPFFDVGHLQSYTASMRGGTESVRYFLSADLSDNTGIVDYNWQRQSNLRANLTLMPHPRVSMDVSTGYILGETSFMQQRTGWGVWEQAQWSNPLGLDGTLRGFLRARPEEIANIEAMRANRRFTGSLTLNHNPWEWLTQRAIIGIDQTNEENKILFPRHPDGAQHDFGGQSLGDIELERPQGSYVTFDYGASARYRLNDALQSTTSYGLQYYHRVWESVLSRGLVFPSPAIRSLAGAANTTATHQYEENKSVGMYLQQELNLNDRLFLTAAVRGDDNSAFGEDFDAAIYPKISGTWVVSEEGFWLDRGWERYLDAFRLRSAWGRAGRQPSTFAAVTLYAPDVGPGGQPAVTAGVLGNPNVGPEVSSELEVGFDLTAVDGRLSSEFTYYTQTVTDALVSVPVSPLSGFPGAQSVNLGQLSNSGWELRMDAQVVRRAELSLDLGAGISKNQNRVDDLAGRPPTGTLREGFPYPARFMRRVVHAELTNPDAPPLERVVNTETLRCDGGTGRDGVEIGGEAVPCSGAPALFYGPATAPWELQFDAGLTLFGNVRIHALVEARTGNHWASSCDVSCRSAQFGYTAPTNYRDDPYFLAFIDGLVPGGSANNDRVGVFNPGFAKLREVSVNYQWPESLTGRIGASRASMNVAGRNLWTIWVKQDHVSGVNIHDPEARNPQGGDQNSNIPPLASVMVTFRVSF